MNNLHHKMKVTTFEERVTWLKAQHEWLNAIRVKVGIATKNYKEQI